MKLLNILKIPLLFSRAWKYNSKNEEAIKYLHEDKFDDALISARVAISFGTKYSLEARMLEAMALNYLKRFDESAMSFSIAMEIISKKKGLSIFDKNYLYVYCYSFFKTHGWPSSIPRHDQFPELPPYDSVNSKIRKTYPMKY